MAHALKLAITAADLMNGAFITDANGGKLRIYTGSQPANPEAVIGAVTMLAELTMPTPSFATANGVMTAGTIVSDSNAPGTGTAAWFRLWKADGTTALLDGTVGAVGDTPDLVIASTTITAGDTVSCSSLTITLPRA